LKNDRFFLVEAHLVKGPIVELKEPISVELKNELVDWLESKLKEWIESKKVINSMLDTVQLVQQPNEQPIRIISPPKRRSERIEKAGTKKEEEKEERAKSSKKRKTKPSNRKRKRKMSKREKKKLKTSKGRKGSTAAPFTSPAPLDPIPALSTSTTPHFSSAYTSPSFAQRSEEIAVDTQFAFPMTQNFSSIPGFPQSLNTSFYPSFQPSFHNALQSFQNPFQAQHAQSQKPPAVFFLMYPPYDKQVGQVEPSA